MRPLPLVFLLAAACMTSPLNDSGPPAPDQPVAFSGFAYRPGATVDIKVLNHATGVHEVIATTTAATAPTTLSGTSLYYWTANAAPYDPGNPATACRFTPECTMIGVGDVYVKAHERGTGDLTTFDDGGIECVTKHLNDGQSWLNAGAACQSPDSPNVRLRYELAPVQAVTASVAQVGAPAAWAWSRGAGVRVAILSTGIDLSHPDLPTPVAAMSFTGSPSVHDGNGSGTQLAGVIAARDNEVGMVGVAPDADLLIGKVLSDSGTGSSTQIAAGIDWAIAAGADVIVCGFSSSADLTAVRDAIGRATAAGVVVIAPVSWDGTSSTNYPAGNAGVIGVGAVNEAGVRLSLSGTGTHVAVTAPGSRVFTTSPVGTGTTSRAEWGGLRREHLPIVGAARGLVTGHVYDCGLATGTAGNTCPAEVDGNIALIRRGSISMRDKVEHAVSKGASGVIIANNAPGVIEATMGTGVTTTAVAVTVSQAEGDALLAGAAADGAELAIADGDYTRTTGTLIAAAHVGGLAALILAGSDEPVRAVIEATAIDLGAPGYDVEYGHGLATAPAAAP